MWQLYPLFCICIVFAKEYKICSRVCLIISDYKNALSSSQLKYRITTFLLVSNWTSSINKHIDLLIITLLRSFVG